MQRPRALLDVVRIDDQRLGHFAGGPGEAAEDQHAALIVAGGDEFLADEVHSVVQAGHQACVGGAIQLVTASALVVARPAGGSDGRSPSPKRGDPFGHAQMRS